MVQAKQASLVAFYGHKPAALRALIEQIQANLASRIGPAFIPRAIPEVHATLVGLEGTRKAGVVYNRNFILARDSWRPMDLAGLLNDLSRDPRLPLDVRFAGYPAEAASPILSRGKPAYVRSFGFQADLAVTIGWPVDARSRPLDALRKSFQRHNVLHKYHADDRDIDDDLFLVVGSIQEPQSSGCADPSSPVARDGQQDRLMHRIGERHVEAAEAALREMMARLAPVQVRLDRSALSLVQYVDPTLPVRDTVQWCLDEAQHHVDAIMDCYPDCSS